MLSCVEFVHSRSFVHRDIKPDNFAMGLGARANQVFIIDFGLAKTYRDPGTHAHVPYVEGRPLAGTARYASVGALRGVEQSRRDDLESLGFVWLYLLRGSLPWMGLAARDQREKYARICQVKARTSFEELCRGFPAEFVRYFHAVRALRFTQCPNYAEFREMFRGALMREAYLYDYRYDWCPPAGAPGAAAAAGEPAEPRTARPAPVEADAPTPRTDVRRLPLVPPARRDGRDPVGASWARQPPSRLRRAPR
jgi:casein kinase 1